MTNEELVRLVKGGVRSFMRDLWEQTERFVVMKAKRFFFAYKEQCARGGVTVDDLVQIGYLALEDAVNSYPDNASYKFLTHMSFPLINRFNGALGFRKTANSRNPLDSCRSLDAPIKGSEGICLKDVIPAEKEQLEEVDDRVFYQQAKQDIDRCVGTLPPDEREAIRWRFYQQTSNKTKRELYNSLTRALRHLRSRDRLRILNRYREEIISAKAYRGVGLTAFNEHGHSSTEYLALLLAELERYRGK